jgi:hypothetical protein
MIDDDDTPDEIEYARTMQEPREPVEQCPMPVHSGYGSAPERCAFPSGHEGECEP